MNIHENARTMPAGRELLVRRIARQGAGQLRRPRRRAHRPDAQSAWPLLLERCVLAKCLPVPVAAFLQVKCLPTTAVACADAAGASG
jgi:hypothetical protein